MRFSATPRTMLPSGWDGDLQGGAWRGWRNDVGREGGCKQRRRLSLGEPFARRCYHHAACTHHRPRAFSSMNAEPYGRAGRSAAAARAERNSCAGADAAAPLPIAAAPRLIDTACREDIGVFEPGAAPALKERMADRSDQRWLSGGRHVLNILYLANDCRRGLEGGRPPAHAGSCSASRTANAAVRRRARDTQGRAGSPPVLPWLLLSLLAQATGQEPQGYT